MLRRASPRVGGGGRACSPQDDGRGVAAATQMGDVLAAAAAPAAGADEAFYTYCTHLLGLPCNTTAALAVFAALDALAALATLHLYHIHLPYLGARASG